MYQKLQNFQDYFLFQLLLDNLKQYLLKSILYLWILVFDHYLLYIEIHYRLFGFKEGQIDTIPLTLFGKIDYQKVDAMESNE